MNEKGETLAFYLKYRPQTFSEVIGQQQAVKTLQSAHANRKLAHAYLLHGPRGTGKTSTARILAKMVNCEEKNVPCNKCDSCRSITNGSNLDLIEIDAASNRGIEDIRSLREKVKLAPTSLSKKVYIIDEVHMLTTEAFNALLKTLEEPPAHVMFILATTEAQKVPQTILSRTIRLDFKLASVSELKSYLGKIIKSEKIDIEEEALNSIINRSEGSFRDAIKLLDQLSSLNKKVTFKDVTSNLAGVIFEEVYTLLESFATKQSKAALLQIKELVEKGVDIKVLITAMMDIMRKLLLIKNNLGEELVKESLFSAQYNSLLKLTEGFSLKDLTSDLNILQEAFEKLKFTPILSLPLELAAVEICEETQNAIRQLVDKSQKFGDKPIEYIPKNGNKVGMDKSAVKHQSIDTDMSDLSKIKEKWTFVLETIRPYNFSLEALLRSASISECTEGEVLMEVPYSFHQRILEAPKNRDLLEGILSDILGRSIHVKTLLGNRPARQEDIANVEVAADDEIIRVAAEIFESEPVN